MPYHWDTEKDVALFKIWLGLGAIDMSKQTLEKVIELWPSTAGPAPTITNIRGRFCRLKRIERSRTSALRTPAEPTPPAKVSPKSATPTERSQSEESTTVASDTVGSVDGSSDDDPEDEENASTSVEEVNDDRKKTPPHSGTTKSAVHPLLQTPNRERNRDRIVDGVIKPELLLESDDDAATLSLSSDSPSKRLLTVRSNGWTAFKAHSFEESEDE